MKPLKITKACTCFVPGLGEQAFVLNQVIATTSPFYSVLKASGNAVETDEVPTLTDRFAFVPTAMYVGEVKPPLRPGEVWIQTFPGTAFYKVWLEEQV